MDVDRRLRAEPDRQAVRRPLAVSGLRSRWSKGGSRCVSPGSSCISKTFSSAAVLAYMPARDMRSMRSANPSNENSHRGPRVRQEGCRVRLLAGARAQRAAGHRQRRRGTGDRGAATAEGIVRVPPRRGPPGRRRVGHHRAPATGPRRALRPSANVWRHCWPQSMPPPVGIVRTCQRPAVIASSWTF